MYILEVSKDKTLPFLVEYVHTQSLLKIQIIKYYLLVYLLKYTIRCNSQIIVSDNCSFNMRTFRDLPYHHYLIVGQPFRVY